MSVSRAPRLSRRSILASALAPLPPFRTVGQSNTPPAEPPSFDLPHGLKILDYRLFPTEDETRFIVELQNTTDYLIDTPSVGVSLTHLESSGNFGWAVPVSAVLHAHSSACLVGIAPAGLAVNEDWGEPDWLLCDDIKTFYVKRLDGWDIEFTSRIEILGPEHARAILEVTNNTSATPFRIYLQGVVRDRFNRICGTTLPIRLSDLDGGTTIEAVNNLRPTLEYVANPFVLLDSTEGIDVSFSLQPQGPAVNHACPAIMPWNR